MRRNVLEIAQEAAAAGQARSLLDGGEDHARVHHPTPHDVEGRAVADTSSDEIRRTSRSTPATAMPASIDSTHPITTGRHRVGPTPSERSRHDLGADAAGVTLGDRDQRFLGQGALRPAVVPL